MMPKDKAKDRIDMPESETAAARVGIERADAIRLIRLIEELERLACRQAFNSGVKACLHLSAGLPVKLRDALGVR